jgi:catechol 2,3-dioxygenase-like lactoylglutathione lyase family enzyme
MLSDAVIVSFIPTSDLERSDAFYTGTLGLERREATPLANAYEVNGSALRVTLVEEPPSARHTVLGWRVTDITGTIVSLGARGVSFKHYPNMEQDDDGVWTAPGGSRIAWFEDPDGNILSLQEPPA